MFVAVATKSSWHAVGEQMGSMILFVNRTYSETGQVKLASADWRVRPEVEFNLLSDRRDLERLVDGWRHLASMYAHDALAAVTAKPFPASWGDKVRQVGAVTTKNAFLTSVMARLLDGPAALRDYLINKVIVDGYTTDQLMADDDAMEEFAHCGGRCLACIVFVQDGRCIRPNGRHGHERQRTWRSESKSL